MLSMTSLCALDNRRSTGDDRPVEFIRPQSQGCGEVADRPRTMLWEPICAVRMHFCREINRKPFNAYAHPTGSRPRSLSARRNQRIRRKPSKHQYRSLKGLGAKTYADTIETFPVWASSGRRNGVNRKSVPPTRPLACSTPSSRVWCAIAPSGNRRNRPVFRHRAAPLSMSRLVQYSAFSRSDP